MIILSLAVTCVAAQDAISPFVGGAHTYQVENHTGSSYEWQVYDALNPLSSAASSSYNFISVNTSSTIEVQWLMEGIYYLTVTEFSTDGCSNLKAIRIEVTPNNLGFSIANSTTTQCYQETDNSITVDVSFDDGSGNSWSQDRFPAEVAYAVNGVQQPIQTVEYSSRQLRVSDNLFSASPNANTTVTITLLEITDALGITAEAEPGQNTQTTTIQSTPSIDFDTDPIQTPEGTIASYSATGLAAYTYHWSIQKPGGTILELSSETTATEEIDWNQPGIHVLSVEATNAEGCQSETLSKTITVISNDNLPVAYIAADTVLAGSCLPVQIDASGSYGQQPIQYQWEPNTYLDDAQSSTPEFTAGRSTNYVLTVTDSNGFSAKDTVFVQVASSPEIVMDRQVFVNSPTDVIMLDASSSLGEDLSYNWWTEGDELIINGAQSATPQVSGMGTYYLEISDQFGCSVLDSVNVGLLVQVTAFNDTVGVLVNTFADINVLRNDMPQGQLDPESVTIVMPPDHGVAVVSSDSIITYTPDQYYVGQDNFIYAVCDFSNQCDEATVLVMITDDELFVPNAFSPNGDGINDYFEIKGIGQYEQVSMKIFNRWGNLVYQSANYGMGISRDGFWDGTVNKGIRTGSGQVPAGTYYYILDLGVGNEKINGYIYVER
ncbi:T9SS type B sorting domain-containing protein [Sunxiuqinia indica]|uniref:T9SS type B sorting domain-containing protein n=1 Tax=Sunxiuqinia indica TaxID=2692584 RepID=UPI00135B887A|nr:gliding motility-associated C-terminal domain-containing protein [Sunxiuqinia indica]